MTISPERRHRTSLKRLLVLFGFTIILFAGVVWCIDWKFGLWPRFATATESKPAQNYSLRVVDEQGQPLSEFEARAEFAEGGGSLWSTGTKGNWNFLNSETPKVADFIVRADGYASSITRLAGDEIEKLTRGDVCITMVRGEKAKIHFRLPDGLKWPEAVATEIYFSSCAKKVRIMREPMHREIYNKLNAPQAYDQNMLNVKSAGPGDFEFLVAPDVAPFYVAIHSPGFLQSFEAGPFTAANFKNGALEIPLPQPARIGVRFDPGEDTAARPYSRAVLVVRYEIPGTSNSLAVGRFENLLESKSIEVHDLSPGKYWVMMETAPLNEKQDNSSAADAGHFFERHRFVLNENESKQIDIRYVPFDPNAFRGKRTAIVRLETYDGRSAAGRNVKIEYCGPHYRAITIFSGTVPASGELELKDITEVGSTDSESEPYVVYLDGKQLGTFGFHGEQLTEKFLLRSRPEVGDQAPDVELLEVATGKKIRLSDFRGKLVVLDLWATWCGPCQPAIQALDRLVEKNAAAWKDRVVVAPVSIDDTVSSPKQHLIDRGWTNLNSYWSGADGRTDFESPIMRAFGAHAVPETLIIGADGKILWRGNPQSGDNGQELQNLIQRWSE